MTLDPNKRDQQIKVLNQLLSTIYEDRSRKALSLWLNISNWLRQKRLRHLPLIIILQCYLQALQAIDAGEPIPISMAEFQQQCRLLVKEQAQNQRLEPTISSVYQLLDEIQALLKSWGNTYYEDSKRVLENAISLQSDVSNQAERRQQLDIIMQLIYRQQQTGKDTASFSFWPDVTNHLRQNRLDLEADEVVLLCYFQAVDDIAREKPFPISIAWMREQCNLLIKQKAKLLTDGVKFSRLYEDVIRTLEERTLNANNGDYRLLNQQETAGEAFQSLSQEDQEILRLRLLQGLSYKSIQLRLFKTNGGNCSVAALRQRVSRAIHRLRKAYILLS